MVTGTVSVRGSHRACGICALVAAAGIGTATASESAIYMSLGADGTARYATQKLDETYRPLVSGPRAPSIAPSKGAMDAWVNSAARRHNLPPELVHAIIAVESRHDAAAVSAKGAIGAMQLMPQTAASYGVAASKLGDPQTNIELGVRHFKAVLTRYNGNVVLALAAYNSGTGAVGRHGNRIPPYRETMLYVPAVLAEAARRSDQ